ncbi:MAG TPA: hypothetical protein VFY61_00495 [Pyrinomonadaceae bacterium]|nr:hypothetical protein [Pyrinomonadaceae bacterium]
MQNLLRLAKDLFVLASFLLFTTNAVLAQNYRPAIEHESLLSMRFYEATGGFLVEGLEVVFPPAGNEPATFEITKPSGEVVASVPLRLERIEGFPAFAVFRPAIGNPGNVKVAQTGDFVMSVKIGNVAITKVPFSLKEEVSGDPFKPGKSYVREGPWRDLAFAATITDDPNAFLQFNWWMSTRELPAGMTRPKVTVHVLHNGKEIAASRGPVVPDTLDWYFYERHELYMPTLPKNKWLTLADLTKLNGEIAFVVKANGQPVKTYKTQVSGGQLRGLEQSRLGYEPHASFISPRYVDLADRSRSSFTMRDMFWLKRTQ